MKNLLFSILIIYGSISVSLCISRCHSCFSGCLNLDECDCTSSANETCSGDFCFVKLDRLTNSGLGAIRKGCANWAPDEYTDVCQYVSDNTTIECYCKGDSCNNNTHFRNYQIQPLPLISCCECEGYNYENGTIDCLPDSCLRNCTGNYCFNDLVRQSQGCGWGHAYLWQFLRNTHRVDRPRPKNSTASAPWPWAPDGGDMTCTEAFADWKTALGGCTCSYDSCNMQDTASYYNRNETEVRSTAENYCYTVHVVSSKPITADAYRDSGTHEGHFCFVTLTTNVLAFGALSENASLWGISKSTNFSENLEDDEAWPRLAPRYELTAGYMNVDDGAKVELGCTTEWSESESRPTKKHCVCAGHICNYFNLITGDDRNKFLAFDWKTSKDYKSVSSAPSWRHFLSAWTILLIGSLFAIINL